MNLENRCDSVTTRTDLVGFIDALRRDLHTNPQAWENPTLERYLEALKAWTRDMDGYFKNQGLDESQQPTWNLIAQLLLAASMYE